MAPGTCGYIGGGKLLHSCHCGHHVPAGGGRYCVAGDICALPQLRVRHLDRVALWGGGQLLHSCHCGRILSSFHFPCFPFPLPPAIALGDKQVQADVLRLTGQLLPTPDDTSTHPLLNTTGATAIPAATEPAATAPEGEQPLVAEQSPPQSQVWVEELILGDSGTGVKRGGRLRGEGGGGGGGEGEEEGLGRVGEPGVGEGEEKGDSWLVAEAERAVGREKGDEREAVRDGVEEEDGSVRGDGRRGSASSSLRERVRGQAKALANSLLFTMYMGTENR